jgi:hypothetical protein
MKSEHELFHDDLSVVDIGSYETSNEIISKTEENQILEETVRQLKARLVRRTLIIDEIRKCYLRDVISIKHIVQSVLQSSERDEVFKQYESNLPSIDLKKGLPLHAPTKVELEIKFCGECGGHLEFVNRDNDEVAILKKQMIDVKDREGRWRIKLATLDAELERISKDKAETSKAHFEEVI